MTAVRSERLTSERMAGELFIEGPTPARFWGDQWLRVSEKLLKGLNHQLTNRVASLDGAVSFITADGSADREVVDMLSVEVKRLHELLHLYRLLTAEPTVEPEPVRLQDLAPSAARLHENHIDLRQIECVTSAKGDVPPVIVRPTALLRCLLVLLSSVAGNAIRSGSAASMAIDYGVDGAECWIRIKGPAPRGQLLFSGEGSLLHAVRAALAHAHASADGVIRRGQPSEPGDEIEYELRFPALESSTVAS